MYRDFDVLAALAAPGIRPDHHYASAARHGDGGIAAGSLCVADHEAEANGAIQLHQRHGDVLMEPMLLIVAMVIILILDLMNGGEDD